MSRREERVDYVRLFVTLAILVAVAAGLAVLIWWGKGWPEGYSQEPAEEARIREPTVAGSFYPADPNELYAEVEKMFAASPEFGLRGVRSLLVPHAGYVYSGEVAAASFREVEPGFRRVFIIAGNHSRDADYAGVSIPEVTHYEVPGAKVPLAPIVEELRQREFFVHEPAAHTMHIIEVELPFLHFLQGRPAPPGFTIVPLVCGRMEDAAVEQLAEVLSSCADEETLFVFSVDLSHYYTYEEAQKLDDYSIRALLTKDQEALGRATTDANQVLQVMVGLAERQGWESTFVTARNSGDVSGDRDRVVGYASVVFHEPLQLTEAERKELLSLARRTLEGYVIEDETPEPDPEWLERFPIFRVPRGVFVTLKKEGELRGCVGELISRKPLYLGVQNGAVSAGAFDRRFEPVEEEELAELTYTISVLTFPSRVKVDEPADYLRVLKPLEDGVILFHAGKQSTFLPQVWKELSDPEEFLSRLCLKQGAPADAWKDPETVLYRYGACVFGEEAEQEEQCPR